MQSFAKAFFVSATFALAWAGVSQAQVAIPLERSTHKLERVEEDNLLCRAVYVRGWTESGVNRMSRENATCPVPGRAAIGDECTCERRLSSGATEIALGRAERRFTITDRLRTDRLTATGK